MNCKPDNPKHTVYFPPENAFIYLQTAKDNLPVSPAEMNGKRFSHEAGGRS
ncbi:hypothetical protein ESCAB7627_4512 [Escherichia albertii TW07627]|uniref:Uncharacterized protein n=2 Tax=Escherichia albertii TaxID=208962 RepID=A0ABC9NSD0_ESCAT|nr:hypothetical protein EAKF1_ch2436c [Escherichia albertii KF1]EDS93112.1 hypothetical protein ESCAB7627_4512 [Escherichia albertii TW07627]